MTKKKIESNIRINFLLNTVYQVLSIVVVFVTTPYISRVLGVETIGIFSFTNSIVSYFTMFAVLGTVTYGTREISRTRDNKELNTKLFWEIEILSIFTSLLMLLLWGIFVIFAKQYKLYYIILSLNLINCLFDISWFYIGLEKFKFTVSRNLIIKIIGIFLIFIFIKTPNDLWLYILINSGIALLGNLSMWVPLKHFLVRINIRSIRVIPHLKQTLVYFIPTIAVSFYHILDKTLIGIITKQEEQNGYYEQAVKIINLIKTLCYFSINTVFSTRNSYLFEHNRIDEIKTNIEKALNFIMFMSIGSCFGLLGIAKNFVPVFFGDGYLPTILLLQLLSPVLIIIGVSTCLSNLYFIPAGLRKQSAMFVIVGACANLIFNIIFIPIWGSVGAVIGTLLAESIILMFYVYFGRKIISLKTIFLMTWKKLIAAIIMYLFVYFSYGIKVSASKLLVIQIFTGVAIYVSVLFLLRDKSVVYLFTIFKNIVNKKK